MADRERQRFLFIKNRLEELAAKYGPTLEPVLDDVDTAPTWGPVGSLAARYLAREALEELMRLHRNMLELERSRHHDSV